MYCMVSIDVRRKSYGTQLDIWDVIEIFNCQNRKIRCFNTEWFLVKPPLPPSGADKKGGLTRNQKIPKWIKVNSMELTLTNKYVFCQSYFHGINSGKHNKYGTGTYGRVISMEKSQMSFMHVYKHPVGKR